MADVEQVDPWHDLLAAVEDCAGYIWEWLIDDGGSCWDFGDGEASFTLADGRTVQVVVTAKVVPTNEMAAS